jgi:hypothetical protein
VGHVYLLTAIDRSNRWVEAAQLCNMEASRFTDAFIANCVAHFGMQAIVTTDRGSECTSAVWTFTCTRQGIQHMLNNIYHPQSKSNRMVERVHSRPKMPCLHVVQAHHGTPTYPECCWGYVQYQRACKKIPPQPPRPGQTRSSSC